MIRLLVFILAVYGAAAAVTVLRIGKPLRLLAPKIPGIGKELEHFLSCPACVGFWLGAACSFWVYAGPAAGTLGGPLPLVAIDGLVTCGSCWIIHVVLVKLGQFDL